MMDEYAGTTTNWPIKNYCNHLRGGWQDYCRDCGAQLRYDCPVCGNRINLPASYCGGCGRKVMVTVKEKK